MAPTGPTSLLVSWSRPVASGSADGQLTYTISRNTTEIETVNDSVTMYTIEGLRANTIYTIGVCVYLYMYAVFMVCHSVYSVSHTCSGVVYMCC